MVLRRIREVAKTVTAVGAAVAMVVGLLAYAGPLVAVGAVSGVGTGAVLIGGMWLAREIGAVRSAVETVQREFSANGSEALLTEDERGKPLRELIVRSRADLRRGSERFRGIEEWIAGHEEAHATGDGGAP